jgi:NAD(P)-dependent dehydrogenase (short-subunit alcohol dehydrogenase family)
MNLKSKIAVVTGAASGIGGEIASTFWVDGAKVVVADLNQAGAAAAAAEFGDADSAIGIGMDTDETQVEIGMAAAVASFRGIDMLLRNAGIHLGSGSTGRGGRNGHPSSQKAMPVARAAGLRWSDFELGGIAQRLRNRGVGKTRAVPYKRNPL